MIYLGILFAFYIGCFFSFCKLYGGVRNRKNPGSFSREQCLESGKVEMTCLLSPLN